MFVQLLPPDLVDRIKRWNELKRWERREIGQTLRKMGLCYREISAVIPVPKGTLSNWCRDLPLPEDRRGELMGKRGGRREVGTKLRQRALERTGAIREQARVEVAARVSDPYWVAGTMAYWAEGSKRTNELCFTNSDVAMVQLFITWCRTYFELETDRFTIRLHFHSGQDEIELRSFWGEQLGLPPEQFRKGYVKQEGTGHRKNVLYKGTVQIRIRCSSELRHRMLGWIDGLTELYGALQYTAARGASSTG